MPETFFTLTPRLVTVVVEGRERLRQTEFERLAWAVHQNAALQLSDPKKFPRLASFMGHPKPKASKASSVDRMMSIANMWNAAINAAVADERGQAKPEA